MTFSTISPVTVLVADHDPDEFQAVSRLLEREKYVVRRAQEGDTLLALIQMFNPDIVLLRTDLPGKSGLELCKEIKESSTFGFLPLLLITDGVPENVQAAISAGADDVLSRPIAEMDMLSRISVLLRMKRHYKELWDQNAKLTDELAKRNFELERTLRESKEVLILKDTIVRNVSHELRTPLLQVKSAVAMLAEDARAASTNGISVLADHATAATAKLESVVQNITQLAASLNVKLDPFRLSDAVNLAVRQLSRQWASSGNVERIIIPGNEVPPILGDRAGVAQVLRQLLDNAIKFSPNGGVVDIKADRNDNTVRISVCDHGIGIPEDQVERIFQAFYQVDSGSTRHFGGTGVGLAIVKLLLDAMGSSINVESKPGEGSTFSFDLPIAGPDAIVLEQVEAAS